MITERDRKILRHVETFGFITIPQARDMFFNDCKFGYDIARKRLKKLVSSGYLKYYRNDDTNENVYYSSQKGKITMHRIVLMNFYSSLIASHVKLIRFDIEKEWMGGKIRSDAFVIFQYGGYEFYQIVEVNISNNFLNLERYETLYDTGEVQSICKGVFPTIVLIDDTHHKVNLKRIKLIQLNLSLTDFPKIFI